MNEAERDSPSLPAHVTTPLLTLITQRSLDEDYAAAAQRRERAAADPTPARPSRPGTPKVVTAVAVGVFALMATVVAVQTQRDAEVDELSRTALVAQVQDRSERVRTLQAQERELSLENQRLMSADTALAEEVADTDGRADRVAMATGNVALRGEGVRLTVDSSTQASGTTELRDEDLATLVDALWHAGAEAVAINGERLTALTGIRNTGRSIHVGGRPVNPPYVVEAIGDRSTLQANLLNSAQGQRWFVLVNELGFAYTPQNVSDLRIPAARLTELRHATVLGKDDEFKGGGSS